MHKPKAADVEFLMLAQQQYLRQKKLPVAGNSVSEDMTLGMLEAFKKELYAVVDKWNLELCRLLGQGCVIKPRQWLEKRWNSKRSLIW